MKYDISKKNPLSHVSSCHCHQQKIFLKEQRRKTFLFLKEIELMPNERENEQGTFPCKETHVFAKRIKVETLNDYLAGVEWRSCFCEKKI